MGRRLRRAGFGWASLNEGAKRESGERSGPSEHGEAEETRMILRNIPAECGEICIVR
ncbi:hypothetical protein BCEP27_30526 [Burkholderia cepacia]